VLSITNFIIGNTAIVGLVVKTDDPMERDAEAASVEKLKSALMQLPGRAI
jgi:hypothetical protein